MRTVLDIYIFYTFIYSLFFDEVVYDRFWPTFVMDAVA